MIRFSDVTKVYDDTGDIALSHVSFNISRGDFVFLVGPTGAGKTTVARLILGAETADSGEVCVRGKNPVQLTRREQPYFRRRIGMVFQDCRLLPDKTVFENVAVAMEAVGAPKRNIERMVPQILSLVGLSEKAASKPSQLSGGEQQRTAMARAMANNPPILVADEPTGNLDPETAREIMYLFERFNRRGTTVVIASHAREIVDSMQRRVIELKKGQIVRDERRGGYYNV